MILDERKIKIEKSRFNLVKTHKAVIVGLYQTGLGIARSLAIAGIEVIGIESNLKMPTVNTGYCRLEPCLDIDNSDILLDKLIEIAQDECEKPVLFMTGDKNVKIVSENREILSRYYHFTLPDKSAVVCLMDKIRFANFAEQKQLDVPRTIVVSHPDRIMQHIDNIIFPCIVKPTYKDSLWGKKLSDKKAFLVNNKEEIAALINNIGHWYRSGLVIQEWIPGDDSNVYFCLMYYGRNSNLRVSFTGRKLLQWLPQAGNTCIAESYYSETIEEKSKNLFDSVKYKGIGSVEFKLNPRDGKFKITEPTVGRSNLQSSIALQAGINIPLAYYCDLVGQLYENKANNKKIIWLEESHLFRYIYHFGIKDILRNKILFKIVFFKKGFAYFCLKDIKPFLYLIWDYIQRMFIAIFLVGRNASFMDKKAYALGNR